MVDELCEVSPRQEKDSFWDDVDVDIAYNVSSVEYRHRHYQGSADVEASEERDCFGFWSVFDFINSLLYYRPRSRGDNTFGSVRVCACVCPSVCVWALSCLNRLTFDH